MIWPIATNPILSLLERSSEKLIHTLLTKFSPRNSLDRPFPFVRTNHDQKYHSSDTNVFGLIVFRKRKQYSQSTWLQINIFFLFLSFKTEKKKWLQMRGDRISAGFFVASSFVASICSNVC